MAFIAPAIHQNKLWKKMSNKKLKDPIGERMKNNYENIFRSFLPKRMPYIIRIDGKAFHSYTRSFDKPWDIDIKNGLAFVSEKLCKNIMGAKLAYCQSDEISILITDYDRLTSEAWFNKNIQKICSVSSSMATAYFNSYIQGLDKYPSSKIALFDARCFVLPKEDVCNYFIWRQKDAIRNSINSLGQKHFSHKELQNKSTEQVKKLLAEKEIIWDDCLNWQKNGWCVIAESDGIKQDNNIPEFSKNRSYIEKYVFIDEMKENRESILEKIIGGLEDDKK